MMNMAFTSLLLFISYLKRYNRRFRNLKILSFKL